MKTKIVVVVGPTATGKSALAVSLARHFNGEIISADSRQVYRGLDIGTGKITKREMRGIRHHLLDVSNPKKQFSAAKYVVEGRRAIESIARRGKLPIICGGTGFYISALLGGENLSEIPPNRKLRAKLAKKSVAELFRTLKKLNPKRAKAMNKSDRQNPRRLIRAIEIAYAQTEIKKEGRRIASRSAWTNRKRTSMPPPPIQYKPFFIGLTTDNAQMKRRIRARLLARIENGMLTEARQLHKNGLSWKRMDELGLEYRYLARFLRGKMTKQEMIEKLNTEIWRYAKRQMMWFKRDRSTKWLRPSETREIQALVSKFLKNKP